MFTVYVLYSKYYNKIYIGQTSDIDKRIAEHNAGLSGYTKRYIPWEIILTEEFETRSQSMKREKELKSERGRRFIWELLSGGVR